MIPYICRFKNSEDYVVCGRVDSRMSNGVNDGVK